MEGWGGEQFPLTATDSVAEYSKKKLVLFHFTSNSQQPIEPKEEGFWDQKEPKIHFTMVLPRSATAPVKQNSNGGRAHN